MWESSCELPTKGSDLRLEVHFPNFLQEIPIWEVKVLSNKVISFLEGKNSSRMIVTFKFIRLGGDFDFPLIEDIHQGWKKGTFLEGNVVRIYIPGFPVRISLGERPIDLNLSTLNILERDFQGIQQLVRLNRGNFLPRILPKKSWIPIADFVKLMLLNKPPIFPRKVSNEGTIGSIHHLNFLRSQVFLCISVFGGHSTIPPFFVAINIKLFPQEFCW